MTSILNSHGVALATAMAISGTVIFLALRREKNFPSTQFYGNQLIPHHPTKQILRSCLSSDGKKRERRKKRVQFADSVKDKSRNGEELRKEKKKKKSEEIQRSSCRTEITEFHGMQGNQVALYNGFLRDRVRNMECFY